MVFHPFITLNTHNNSIKIHPVSHISENQKLIGAIDVKDVDLRTFTKLKFEQQPHHGIFISDTVNYGESNEDRVRILYLPANVGKCEDKFQDLLAWIVVMLTNICIFDISCRYIRQNKRDKL